MKRQFWFVVSCLGGFLLTLYGSCLAGNISEPHPLPFLSFVRYHVVESKSDGDIHERTLRLEVRNAFSKTLYNVKAQLDGLPENVASTDGEVIFSHIGAGAIAISNDPFQISVDMSQQSGGDLKLIWRIECDIDGEHVMGETEVVEDL